MTKLVTPQGNIRYEEIGHGPAIVFLHSALADHRQWHVQVEELCHEYRCITYDLLGYGLSGNAPDHYDPADTLIALLNHVKLTTATLVGSSLGGSISIHAAVRYPKRITAIILAGTGLFGFRPESNAPEPTVYGEYEAALERHDVDRLVDLAEEIWLFGITGNRQHVTEVNRELFRTMYREFLGNHWNGPDYQEMDDTEALASLNVPAYVILGENDTAFGVAVADYLEHTLPRATIFHMPDSAHFPNLSKPQEVNQLLLQWLKKR
jgi:pimeloyl-ACP methyl ester carboxylesterase